jgi:hypothetical protein
MAVLETIGLATTILQATGLGEKIGGWFGGDSGGQAAKKVLNIAQKVTGASTPEEAAEALRENQGLAAELKGKLIEQETEIIRLHLADIQSARAMQVEALRSSDPLVRRYVLYLASFWSFAAAAYIFAITFFPVPEGSERFADTALGFILGTIIAQILNFFFGSSQGSAEKSAIIGEQLREKARKS